VLKVIQGEQGGTYLLAHQSRVFIIRAAITSITKIKANDDDMAAAGPVAAPDAAPSAAVLLALVP